MKEKITNKILKKIEERKEENYKNSKIYENNSQIAYNSTFHSKNDSRLWFGGMIQIVLTFFIASLIKNPSFIFLKSFINPVSATLLLTPISITLGELTRIYLTRNDDKTLKKLEINNKTPDFMRIAREIEYKVKSSIATKNYEINDEVLKKLKKKEINNTSSYSKLINANEELNKELNDYKKELENLIKEQVLCLDYQVNRTYIKELLSQLKKGLTVSTIITTILLFGIILTGISYYSSIPNITLVIKNILINYMGTISLLTPGLTLYFNQNYKLLDRALKDVTKEKPQYEDFVDTVRRQNLIQGIYNKYLGKSKRKLKKYFNQEIKRLTNKIIELQTKIETNNISINILREEAIQKLIKERKTNSIKPKIVEDNKVIRFKGEVKQLIQNK